MLGRAVLLSVLVVFSTASTAMATVRVSRAELSGSQLRIEGTATANQQITVNGVAMTSSDGNGAFKLQRDGFAKPSDCRVAVNDGSATATTTSLSGCSVTTTPTPTPTPSPTPAATPTLSAVRASPTDVLPGTPVTGTVTLSSAAPVGGFTVALESDNPAAATAPASVTVPAGASSATFPVTANVVPNPQSALIIGSAGTVRTYAIVTVWTPSLFNTGSLSILPGGTGSGTITSSPAGINCTITRGNGSGTCTKTFPIGTVVRLTARAASDSSFQGWRGLPGCFDASRVTIARGANIACQPSLVLR